MGTNTFVPWIGDPDPYPLFILLYATFPDTDPPFVTRSFADPDTKCLTLSQSDIIYIFNCCLLAYFGIVVSRTVKVSKQHGSS